MALTGAIGAGMGLVGTAVNAVGRNKRNRKAQQLQIEGQKEMSEFNRQQQMKLWEDTNYQAQMEQMRKAGLNVGLMYGMQGQGGQTNAQTGNVSSQDQEASAGMGIQTAMQAAMNKAQVGLMEAQTEKTVAEKEKLEGIDTEEGKARIESLTQGIESSKAVEALNKVQERLAKIQEGEAWESQQDRLDSIKHQARRMEGEARSVLAEAEVNEETINEKIDIIKTEAISAVLENAFKRARTSKTYEEIRKISHDMVMDWKTQSLQRMQLDDKQDNTRLAEQRLALERELRERGLNQENSKMVINTILGLIGR